jgi:Cof subfamily protein (haloacid dehalogenase superfamily)
MNHSPPAPIRLIALDLDGTLLRQDRSIGERTLKALQAAQRRGVEIVLASGRMTPAMESTAAQLAIDVCMVSYNGAVACTRAAEGRQRLFHKPLAAEVTRPLFAFAHARGYQVNFYHNDVILSEDGPHLRKWIDIYRGRTGSPFRFVERLEDYVHLSPTKLLFVVDPAIRNAIHEELRAEFEPKATIVHTDPEYLEFLDPAVNKGTALTALARKLDISMDAVMAIGDGENDTPMLEVAGWPVAVANAAPLCRAAARLVTDADHEHDGVGEAVERWVLCSQT